jgi:RNA polymerase sigma factor (TIGR02999 family)
LRGRVAQLAQCRRRFRCAWLIENTLFNRHCVRITWARAVRILGRTSSPIAHSHRQESKTAGTTLQNDPRDNFGAAAVTRLLNEAGSGNMQASADLLPLVYEQLRALAARKMRHERSDQTLQATALVHEAYLRLVDEKGDGVEQQQWKCRWHFFAAAAEAMRRILVDNARRRGRLKRGGGRQRASLEEMELLVDDPPDDLLALDEALNQLAEKHPGKAQLVKLRYFAGLTTEEAAQALGISVRTAGRDWAYARAWLYARVTSA